MSKNPSLKKILIIGSGPIIIGQAAEFDYSGTQACISAKEERIETVLVNSNPATIQTDPEIADKVYIEPLTPTVLEKIIQREKPQGILATVGGQTGLNLGSKLWEKNILQKHKVKFLGTDYQSIKEGEDRGLFKQKMQQIGEPVLPSKSVGSVDEGLQFAKEIDFPVILRVAYTLGGTGGNVAQNPEDLAQKLQKAIDASPVGQVLLEKSVVGWGEFEYEMIRDEAGNKLMICNMENIDPMGVHTGESMVVAPSQTISDEDHQRMRASAFRIIESLKIKGGCNVQFAFDYSTHKFYVIEVNPRLSRSSALASKATGYPIAKVATKIALGKTLPEITNDITGKTAFFEPALDYLVIKIPRWPNDKFPEMDTKIGVSMKSTGEVMAIARSFEETMYKAICSLDIKNCPLQPVASQNQEVDQEASQTQSEAFKKQIIQNLSIPNTNRLRSIFVAFSQGFYVEEVAKYTQIHPWFVHKLFKLYQNQDKFKNSPKVFKMVDTCSGEFEAKTPYFYSTTDISKTIFAHSYTPSQAPNNQQPIPAGQPQVMAFSNEAEEKLYYNYQANYDYLIDKAKKDQRELVLDALVFNKEGKVFIQKRRSERKFLPNCWGVIGGHLNKYNSISKGLDKIIKQETGWKLKKIKNLLEIRDWQFEGARKRTLVFEVQAEGDLNQPKLEPEKVSGFLWISKQELHLFYENKNYNERLMYKVCKKGLEMHNEPKKVIILGSGPIRIGQGIEFDYLTVHAIRALQKKGIKAIIINNNPETVSTDYSSSDRLYFEPLTPEFVGNIIKNEKEGLLGVIAQFGGQTAINLAEPLQKMGVKVLGTTAEAIELAENREKTGQIVKKTGYKMPQWEIAYSESGLLDKIHSIGYPVLLRPSFVLGGDGMKVVGSDQEVADYLEVNFKKNLPQKQKSQELTFEKPLLIDKFLKDAIEVDIDFITDGEKTYCFILEQLDKAGVHSGDSSCVFPCQNLTTKIQDQLVEITRKVSKDFGVIGIGNLQCAIKGKEIYVLEVNPRASRTVPFISKCLGFSLTEMATNVILGDKLPQFDFDLEYYKTPEYAWSLKQEIVYRERPIKIIKPKFVAIKWPVFCLEKLTGVNTQLSPLMKSTGEAMTVGKNFAEAKNKWYAQQDLKNPDIYLI
jgi:carbamoylphosphate synthase large subunit/ADP-ribose pyrophosphatase YjhB (NUDIX family)